MAIECSNPQIIKTGTHKNIPKYLATPVFVLYKLTAIYIKIPQRKERIKTLKTLSANFFKTIFVAIGYNRKHNLEHKTNYPIKKIPMKFPRIIIPNSRKEVFF